MHYTSLQDTALGGAIASSVGLILTRCMRRFLCVVSVVAAGLLSVGDAYASGLEITNPVLTNRDDTAGTLDVQFDATWNQSWRIASWPYNWDAVWFFVKFRKNNGHWQHATLAPSGHSAPGGVTIEVGARDPNTPTTIHSNPGVGAFIYRATAGSGRMTLTGIR
ncbi:MAG: hypothetical protein RIS36_1148, partial [Pseudomonadota bacterium]